MLFPNNKPARGVRPKVKTAEVRDDAGANPKPKVHALQVKSSGAAAFARLRKEPAEVKAESGKRASQSHERIVGAKGKPDEDNVGGRLIKKLLRRESSAASVARAGGYGIGQSAGTESQATPPARPLRPQPPAAPPDNLEHQWHLKLQTALACKQQVFDEENVDELLAQRVWPGESVGLLQINGSGGHSL